MGEKGYLLLLGLGLLRLIPGRALLSECWGNDRVIVSVNLIGLIVCLYIFLGLGFKYVYSRI